jgi:hypothetical protein
LRSVRVAFAVLLAGCIATRAPRLEERPRWRITTAQGVSTYDGDCFIGSAFIRKSGKQGFGVTLQLKSRMDCTVAITTAKLRFPHRAITLPAIAPITLPGRSLVYAWLPVRFDGNAAWNADRNTATLELAIAGKTWQIPVEQR